MQRLFYCKQIHDKFVFSVFLRLFFIYIYEYISLTNRARTLNLSAKLLRVLHSYIHTQQKQNKYYFFFYIFIIILVLFGIFVGENTKRGTIDIICTPPKERARR